MNRKKFNISFLTAVVVVLAASLSFGFWKTSSEATENYTGIGHEVTISNDDKAILFTYYRGEQAGIYQATIEGKNVDALTYPESGYDIKPQYSPDGSKILYIHRSFDENGEPLQTLHTMNTDGSNHLQLTDIDNFVEQAVFSTDGETIYFLNAGVFTNYSPITGARPHEFDIYSIKTDGTEMDKLTDYANYQMSDLSISADGESLYFQMFNDEKVKEPSDTFEDNKEIFELSVENAEEVRAFIPKGNFEMNEVFAAAFSRDGTKLAYSAVPSQSKEEKFFKYEVFITEMETDSTTQLTHLGSHASEPVFFNKSDQILFIEQYNWPGKPEKYQLWKMNADGQGQEKVDIELN